ncbi:conserved protein of unknown function [Xenorhabdus bovienii]|uniref:Uncharacterized protein n=1 Tax=Xenorhabdus bovienii TaxID=40576 RepID=A0A0B6X406_XENBV|nr:conserved protein of unknown function [Xenorhabdus bovienii]
MSLIFMLIFCFFGSWKDDFMIYMCWFFRFNKNLYMIEELFLLII